ncbi:MAG: glycosyltransferase family 2 protein [Acidimicrobiales bacterium]
MTAPDVTVAVSTRDRSHFLADLVAALSQQTLAPDRFEVVVVDDGSTDATPEVLAQLATTTPFELRTLRQVNRGAAAGRNVAWREGRGRSIAFTDDDCIPAPGWLAGGLAALDDGARVAVGRTLPHPREADRLALPFARSLTMEDARFFQTANAFYRRDDLEAVGGLDEEFSTGEDTDLGLRVAALGGSVVFVPEALVHHRVHTPDARGAVRGALRWVDLPLVVRRHPEMRGALVHRLFWKRSHPPLVLAVVGAGVALGGHPRAGLALVLPWLHHRLRTAPIVPGRRRRVELLPAALVVDLAEVTAMAIGSIRHRVVVL